MNERESLPEPQPAGRSDLQLVARLQAGEEAAFRHLVEQQSPALLRLARLYVSNAAVAEEVVQEAWLAVIGALGEFQGRCSLKTWLFSIVANRAKTRGVREGRYVELESKPETSQFADNGRWSNAPSAWGTESPEKLLLQAEAMGVIESAVAALPIGQRLAITLRDIEGLSSEEACNVLEVTETNQRVLLHRARLAVRSRLDAYMSGT